MKYIVFGVIALGILFFLSKFKNSSGGENKNMVLDKIKSGAKIIDVRTKDEFGSGAYPGAVNIPVDQLESRLGEIGNKEQPIIVYCRSGNRSGKAREILNRHGFQDVLNGGGLTDMPR